MPSWPSSPAKNRAESSSSGAEVQRGGAGPQQPLGLGQRGRRPGGERGDLRLQRRGRPPRRRTARSTSPPAAAVAASNTSPVSISRCATCGSIRGSTTAEMTAGTRPSRTSEKREGGRGAGDDDVAGGEQPDPAGARRPAHRGEHRLGRAPQQLQQLGELAHALVLRAAARGLGQVHAGAEHPAGVVEHEHPHGVVGQRLLDGAPAAGRASPGTARCGWRGSRGSAWRRRAPPRPGARGREVTPSILPRRLPGGGHWVQMDATAATPTGCPTPPAPPWPTTPFGLYVHVPFCATRCGYCDFNTYTADELGPGANRGRVRRHASIAELAPGRGGARAPTLPAGLDRLLRRRHARPCCRPSDLGRRSWPPSRDLFRVAADVEVTTEANPESVTPGLAGRAARGRLHPDHPGHAVAPPSTCSPCSTAGTRPGRAVAGRRRGAARPASSTSTST